MKELLGFVLIHPEKEDFVFGMHLDDGLEVVLYAPTPTNAKVFKDFEEIKDFVSYLEDFIFDSPKTKNFISLLNALNFANEKTLVVLAEANQNVYLASRNLQKAKVITADQLNTYDVLNAGKLVLTTGSVKTLEEALAK